MATMQWLPCLHCKPRAVWVCVVWYESLMVRSMKSMVCDKRVGFSPSRVRTGDLAVNSHTLYQLSYRRSTATKHKHIHTHTRSDALHTQRHGNTTHHTLPTLNTHTHIERLSHTLHRFRSTTSSLLHSHISSTQHNNNTRSPYGSLRLFDQK